MAIAAASGPLIGGIIGMAEGSYQSSVAKMNAQIAKENAQRALDVSRVQAQDNDLKTSALLGEQEAAQAASGISVSGASQVLTRDSARRVGRRDSMNIIDQGLGEAHNFNVEAANFKAQAKGAMLSGVAGLIGSVFQGAGNLPQTSLMGGAKSTAAASKFVPKPVPKPTAIAKYAKPIGPMSPVVTAQLLAKKQTKLMRGML